MNLCTTEKVQIVKWYYQGHSVQEITSCLFPLAFENVPPPSTSATQRILNNFEKHGCVTPRKHKIVRKNVLSEEHEIRNTMICASFENNPMQSTRAIAAEFGVDKNTVRNVLKRYGYPPLKLKKTDEFFLKHRNGNAAIDIRKSKCNTNNSTIKMPPASKKDCSIILFDLAAKSRQTAIQALLKICCNNFFSGSKDLTKLILLNSDVTENRLNAQHGGYEHINEVVKDVMLYNPTTLFELIENSGTGQANWLEGLHVAAKNLVEEYEGINGIITFQVLFITDLTSPPQNGDKRIIDKITNTLNQIGAFLYVVGPDIEPPFTITSVDNVKIWMEDLQVDNNNQNLTTIKTIISQTKNSVICNYSLGVHLFFSYRNWGGTQPWNVPLGIGSTIQIPAQTMKILNDTVQCKLVSSEGSIRPSVWIDAEDESIEFDARDVINGIQRHGKFVPISDNKMFQVSNPRSFGVLCFTDASNVPEYLMRGGGCYCVLPDSKSEKNEALNILIDCLAQQNKYVIAQRVYNNNYVPKIVVLILKPDYNPKCFVLTSLPYGEDVRINYKEKKVDAAIKSEINQDVYSFLDSIDVDNVESVKKLPLGITMMQNSNVQRIINKAVDKVLDKHMNLEEIDLNVMNAVSGKTVDALKSVWPSRKLREVKKEAEDASANSDEDFDWD